MRFIFYFCISLTAFQSFAQVHEEMRVIYRDIRVHVVDKDGNPVRGLTRDNFRVKESKQPRESDYFEEVDLGPIETSDQNPAEKHTTVVEQTQQVSEPQQARRFIVLFMDSSNMTQNNFERARESMLEMLDQRLKDTDKIKLVQLDSKFQHISGFTSNKDMLRKEINSMRYEGRLRRNIISAQRSIRSTIEEWDQVPADMKGSFEVLVNSQLREKARVKADFYRTYFYNMVGIGHMMEHIKGSKSVFLFSGGGYVEHNSAAGGTIGDAIEMGRIFNRADCTVYSMMFASPQPTGGMGESLNLTSVPPGWGRTLKYYSEFPPTDTSAEVASNTIMEDNKQFESGPSMSAEETGGYYVKTYNGNNAGKQLDRIMNIANHYYRLGWAVEKIDSRTKVKVELINKEKGWKLFYGKELEPETPYLDLKKDRRKMAFQAMLLYGQTWRNDLDAEWSFQLFSRKGGGYRIAVMGRFPAGDPPKKGYEFGFIALDENNEPLDMTTMTLTNLPEVGETLAYYEVLLVDRMPRLLRTSVRNMNTGDLGFHQFELDAANDGGDLMRIGDVMLATNNGPKSLALNHLRVVDNDDPLNPDMARRDEDPFIFNDRIFQPAFAPYSFEPGVLWFMFHVENPLDKPYQVQYLVKGANGFLSVPGKIGSAYAERDHNLHIQGVLNGTQLEPGNYLLAVRMVYEGRDPVMGNVPFIIR